MRAKGTNGTVTFDGHNVIITREGFTARMQHGKGEKRIPLRAISAIQWKDPGVFSGGFIQFTIGGGIEQNVRKGVRTWNAMDDENSVVFSSGKEAAAMREVRDAIQAAMDQAAAPPPPPPTSGPPAGWYNDPQGGPDQRWWDGSSWTEHTQPREG